MELNWLKAENGKYEIKHIMKLSGALGIYVRSRSIHGTFLSKICEWFIAGSHDFYRIFFKSDEDKMDKSDGKYLGTWETEWV